MHAGVHLCGTESTCIAEQLRGIGREPSVLRLTVKSDWPVFARRLRPPLRILFPSCWFLLSPFFSFLCFREPLLRDCSSSFAAQWSFSLKKEEIEEKKERTFRGTKSYSVGKSHERVALSTEGDIDKSTNLVRKKKRRYEYLWIHSQTFTNIFKRLLKPTPLALINSPLNTPIRSVNSRAKDLKIPLKTPESIETSVKRLRRVESSNKLRFPEHGIDTRGEKRSMTLWGLACAIRRGIASAVFRAETAESHAKVEAEWRCSALRAAFGVLVKCASAVPRSVQAGGWSPFRDVYGCVVAKWLYAIAREPYSFVAPAGSKT